MRVAGSMGCEWCEWCEQMRVRDQVSSGWSSKSLPSLRNIRKVLVFIGTRNFLQFPRVSVALEMLLPGFGGDLKGMKLRKDED